MDTKIITQDYINGLKFEYKALIGDKANKTKKRAVLCRLFKAIHLLKQQELLQEEIAKFFASDDFMLHYESKRNKNGSKNSYHYLKNVLEGNTPLLLVIRETKGLEEAKKILKTQPDLKVSKAFLNHNVSGDTYLRAKIAMLYESILQD